MTQRRHRRRFPESAARRKGVARVGFTLVELLVVIGIIVVLIAILIPVVSRVRRAANGASTSSQLAAIATAIQAYYGDFHAYPGPLPNSQLGITYYPQANYSPPNFVYVTDPNNNNAVVKLTMATGTGASQTYSGTFTQVQQITGAENLVLGLLGGLELQFTANSNPATIQYFDYNPTNIFPDGVTPSPKGAMNLNPNSPKRFPAYLQVRSGDISNCQAMGAPTVFTDAAQRMANDSPIPEFVDKFPQAMPILYLRANVGGTAVVGIGGGATPNSTPLQDSTVTPAVNVVPQYDLAQIQGYTGSTVGTNAESTTYNQHGLQMPAVGSNDFKFGNGTTADTIAGDFPANACVYFKDPSVNYDPTNNPNLSDTHAASARQKDGFILISAGPDGIYGTADDIIYPGSLNP